MTESPSTLTGSHPSLSRHISSSERLGSRDRPDSRQSGGRERTAAYTAPHALNRRHSSPPRSRFLLVLRADSADATQKATCPNNRRDCKNSKQNVHVGLLKRQDSIAKVHQRPDFLSAICWPVVRRVKAEVNDGTLQ